MAGRSIEEVMVLRKTKELEKVNNPEQNVMYEISTIGRKPTPMYDPEDEDEPPPSVPHTKVRSVALVKDHNQEVTNSLTKYCKTLQNRVAVRKKKQYSVYLVLRLTIHHFLTGARA